VPNSYLEIVEMEDGEIVLQRADDDSEPLVRIYFSDESRDYMMDKSLDVARVMIQAGMQAVAELAERGEVVTGLEGDELGRSDRILH